jgi:hypothetical protein
MEYNSLRDSFNNQGLSSLDIDKKIKTIIEEVIKKKLKNNYVKDNKVLNIDYIKKIYNLDQSKLKLRKKEDIKNIFRVIENNNLIPRSIDIIYKKFVARQQSFLFNYSKSKINEEIKKCSGYELFIDPLKHIQIFCSVSKYNYIMENNQQINNYINNNNGNTLDVIDTSLEEFGEYEKKIQFYYNEADDDDTYKETVLKIISNILLEIFLLCNYTIIPLQVGLQIYDDKEFKTAGQGYYPDPIVEHRTFILFTRENNSYKGYYYDPEGYIRDNKYLNKIYEIIENIKYNKGDKSIEVKTIHKSCPLGLQSVLKDNDFGLCTVYSHFWFDCFVEILSIINNYNKLHEKDKKETQEKLKINYGDFTKYVEYINECMINIPKRMFLKNLGNDRYKIIFIKQEDINKVVTDNNLKHFDNEMIVKLFVNYALYVIGYTYSILSNNEKKVLLEYINEIK